MGNAIGPAEREAIGLCVCTAALDDLVNHDLMQLTINGDGEMEVRFHARAHRSLFLIRLLDFVSEKGSAGLLGVKSSCLDVLEQVADQPVLGDQCGGEGLAAAVVALKSWMDAPITPTVWLPSIGTNARLSVTRHQLLEISGNQAKHNPSRLSAVSGKLQAILGAAGHQVAIDKVPFALGDLRDHLEGNLFIYYATWIAELLNNVRWAIHRYLEPVYRTVYRKESRFEGDYTFALPPGLTRGSAPHMWFHDLMNHVRSGPIVPPFRAWRFLREESSLEWPDANPPGD
ncbi:hypothetical protein KPL74_08755 [Bacillus sp. NP157]|nr:hypothetical protein KPL74_08755 [Bacillus sp. NP157]